MTSPCASIRPNQRYTLRLTRNDAKVDGRRVGPRLQTAGKRHPQLRALVAALDAPVKQRAQQNDDPKKAKEQPAFGHRPQIEAQKKARDAEAAAGKEATATGARRTTRAAFSYAVLVALDARLRTMKLVIKVVHGVQ